jgi:hypothetical protein
MPLERFYENGTRILEIFKLPLKAVLPLDPVKQIVAKSQNYVVDDTNTVARIIVRTLENCSHKRRFVGVVQMKVVEVVGEDSGIKVSISKISQLRNVRMCVESPFGGPLLGRSIQPRSTGVRVHNPRFEKTPKQGKFGEGLPFSFRQGAKARGILQQPIHFTPSWGGSDRADTL